MELTARIYNIYTETLSSILNAAGTNALSRAELYAVAQNSVDMIGPSFLPVLLACAELMHFPNENNSPAQPDGSSLHNNKSCAETSPGLTASAFTASSDDVSFLDHLYRSWIKTVLADTRVHLLVPGDVLDRIQHDLKDIFPLFEAGALDAFRPTGGDLFTDTSYLELMRTLVHAQQNRQILRIQYRGSQNRIPGYYQPLRFEYAASADRFRIHLQKIESGSVISAVAIDTADITDIRLTGGKHLTSKANLTSEAFLTSGSGFAATASEASTAARQPLFDEYLLLPPQEPLILEITGGHDVWKRCQRALAKYDKRVEYDQASRTYTCLLSYKPRDENSLLTRLLDLDPSVRVLSPPRLARMVRANRLQRQELRMYKL